MAEVNSDMPEGIPEPQMQGPAPIQQGSMAHEAFYDKLQQAQGKIDVVQNVLGQLMQMGDMVTQEDVIKGASRIVSAGVSPEGMASLLADMPDKQEMLGPWLMEHKATFDKQEQAIKALSGSVRHQMGAEAMGQLLGQQSAPPAVAPSAGALGPQPALADGNSLMEQ